MTLKVVVTWRGMAGVTEDREKIITDLAAVGPFLTEGPKDWTVAYLCITELGVREPAARIIEEQAA